MRTIKEVVVVEGKTDTATLKQLFNVDTIETGGSAINDEIIEQIKVAAEKRGVIILTDPDYPGQQIRNKIIAQVPHARHAFVDKKDAIGKKKLGIAEAKHEAIITALENSVEFMEMPETLSWDDFLDLDIIGHSQKRAEIYHLFGLGHGNNKTLFKRLNMIGVSKQEIIGKYKAFKEGSLL